MVQHRIGPPRASRHAGVTLAILVILLFIGVRTLASYSIEYAWWNELGQLSTWFSMLTYNLAPLAGATLAAFAVLWITHARALKLVRTGLGDHPTYLRILQLVLLVVGYMVST